MSLQALARSALTFVKTHVSESSVSVNVGGDTATGVVDTLAGNGALQDVGEIGPNTRTVFVSVADITKPEVGATITVDNVKGIVTGVRTDPTDALYAIEYQETLEES